MLVPSTDIDIFSEDVRANPWPYYKALRDAGPVVRLANNDLLAIARFKDVKAALGNWKTFSSAKGVSANQLRNANVAGGVLESDDPVHAQLRSFLQGPVLPGNLAKVESRFQESADQLIDKLAAQGEFDAVTELAHPLPVNIVSELVGLPDEGRANMLEWASASFDTMGANNERAQRAAPKRNEALEYVRNIKRETLLPGSWGDILLSNPKSETFDSKNAKDLLFNYVGPSLDTTINAIGHAVWLFYANPEQWDIVRAEPALIPRAIDEVLRIEPPVQHFTRFVTQDHEIDGVSLPTGSRALVMFASANRDERKWGNPEVFDVRRDSREHLTFGAGPHMCMGMHLAKLEMRCLLNALVRRVKRFRLVGEPVRQPNNTLRGFSFLPISIEIA
jgi:cytochrome P450